MSSQRSVYSAHSVRSQRSRRSHSSSDDDLTATFSDEDISEFFKHHENTWEGVPIRKQIGVRFGKVVEEEALSGVGPALPSHTIVEAYRNQGIDGKGRGSDLLPPSVVMGKKDGFDPDGYRDGMDFSLSPQPQSRSPKVSLYMYFSLSST